MVQHRHENDRPVSFARVSQLEGFGADLHGLNARKTFGRDSRRCSVGFQTRYRTYPGGQTRHKVPGSASHVKNRAGSIRPHLAHDPRTVEIVMAPRMIGVDAIKPRKAIHRLRVTNAPPLVPHTRRRLSSRSAAARARSATGRKPAVQFAPPRRARRAVHPCACAWTPSRPPRRDGIRSTRPAQARSSRISHPRRRCARSIRACPADP